MAKNVVIPPKAAADIEERVDRVIRGLGNPEPPLRLEDVRELLRLDRRFYTAADTSAADEVVSKIRGCFQTGVDATNAFMGCNKEVGSKGLVSSR